jgi:putative tryptophan/tyrosine transport system substrate-binding protein
MHRRKFVTLLGSAAAWPLAARAQQAAAPLVATLFTGSGTTSPALEQGLAEVGFSVGRDVAVEYHWVGSEYEQLASTAADFVRRRVAVIVTLGTDAALAAKSATATIPIVFGLGTDPIKLGLVASLNRPGGNLTGATILSNVLEAKGLQLLHELVPRATLIAALFNPSNRNAELDTPEVQAAADALGLRLLVLRARDRTGIETAFATATQQGAGALLVSSDNFFAAAADQFAALEARHRIPAAFDRRKFTVAGGLMSYGASIDDEERQIGVYAGRILKGEKPADLPIVQPTKFDFVINLKTARLLGVEVPPLLVSTANEVIE